MKLYTISEKEFIYTIDQDPGPMENLHFSWLLRYPENITTKVANPSQEPYSGPGQQVINNILNYARSLEVLHISSGEPMLLIGN